MTAPRFTFAAENAAAGFTSYRDLYATGTDVTETGLPFQAQVNAHRFENLMIFERRLGGGAHSRDPARVRRDGYDHFALQPGRARHLMTKWYAKY